MSDEVDPTMEPNEGVVEGTENPAPPMNDDTDTASPREDGGGENNNNNTGEGEGEGGVTGDTDGGAGGEGDTTTGGGAGVSEGDGGGGGGGDEEVVGTAATVTDAPHSEQPIESPPLSPTGEPGGAGMSEQTSVEAEAKPAPTEGAASVVQQMTQLSNTLQMENEGEVADDGTHIKIIFTIRPEGFVLHGHFNPSVPCVYLYTKVSRAMRLDKRVVRLFYEGRGIGDTDILMDVVTIPQDGSPLFFDVELEQMPSVLGLLSAGEHIVTSFSTEVDFGEGNPPKTVNVVVTKGFQRKPFIGGHRHKKTGLVFHEAIAQTVRPAKERVQSDRASRLVQTNGVTRSVQTHRECATQMSRADLVVETCHDRVVVAKRYFSWDELAALQVLKAIVLQSYVRGWFARKHARVLRQDRVALKQHIVKAHQQRLEDHEKKKAVEIERRMHPRSAKDFAVLYDELEAWRLQETQRIQDADITPEEKHFALQELLKKETKLLQTIDKLQLQATKENRQRNVETTLNAMAGEKKWGTVNVETPYTLRAKELRDLYNGLQMRNVSIDERLDVLLHVKWTVKEFDCPLTREVVDLIDREADLLNRGRKSNSLEGLRRRVSNLFLQFLETPEFNPEALHYTRVPLEYTSRPLVKLDVKR
eukprot:PhF_6_TR2314/c0_g1_i1/m.4084